MLKIHKTQKAENDLIAIWLYSFTEWGEAQADFYLGELEHAIKMLGRNPKMGSVYMYREGYRKFLINSHLIFYRLKGKNIEIVRVLHKRMDINKNL